MVSLEEINEYKEIIEKTISKSVEVLSLIQSPTYVGNDSDIDIINAFKERLEKELIRTDCFIDTKEDRINEQYKIYIEHRIQRISVKCSSFLATDCNKWNYSSLISTADEITTMIGSDSTFDLFEQFKSGDSNYVLFGKNGAGKTTLLNELSRRMFSFNSIVISATRNINYDTNIYHQQSEINLPSAINFKEEGKSMFALSQLVIHKEISQRRSHLNDDEIITNKIIKVFNSLGTDRFLKIGENGELELYAEGGKPYSLSQASDGEKSAMYFIMIAFLTSKSSFLIIDEPENHLNGSLMKKLFDCLEKERSDLRFVYSTHNIGFIESRSKIEIVYLKKTNSYNFWEFNKFSDYKNLPLDIILNVEGTNDDVIFCEGEDNNSFDVKLYQLLFENYQIVPSNGCDRVILQTNIFNDNALALRKKAHGIVDNDFRDTNCIKKLKSRNVFVLKINEIENSFMLSNCLQKMVTFFELPESKNSIKQKVIDCIKHKINEIKKDFASKLLRRIHSKNKIDNLDDISASIDALNSANKNEFINEFSSFCALLDNCLNSSNYNELMRIVPGKMIINEVAKLFGFSGKEPFVRQMIILIKEDNLLKDSLRKSIIDF